MIDPAVKTAFVGLASDLFNRLLDSESATARGELPFLARPFYPPIVRWIKIAFPRAMGKAIDFLDGRLGSLTGSQMLASGLTAMSALLKPHQAALVAAQWGEELHVTVARANPIEA